VLAIATEQPRLKMANPHPIQIQSPEVPFHARNALKSSMSAAGVGFAGGFLASAVQNSLVKHNVGAMGVFTRTGGTVATFSMSWKRLPPVAWAASRGLPIICRC
jgi:hypothetical protein